MNNLIGQSSSWIYSSIFANQNYISQQGFKTNLRIAGDQIAAIVNSAFSKMFGSEYPKFTPVQATAIAATVTIGTITILSFAALAIRNILASRAQAKPADAKAKPTAAQAKPTAAQAKTAENVQAKAEKKSFANPVEELVNAPVENLTALIKAGLDPNATIKDDETALMVIARRSKTDPKEDDLKRIDVLVANGANPLKYNDVCKRASELCKQSGPVYDALFAADEAARAKK